MACHIAGHCRHCLPCPVNCPRSIDKQVKTVHLILYSQLNRVRNSSEWWCAIRAANESCASWRNTCCELIWWTWHQTDRAVLPIAHCQMSRREECRADEETSHSRNHLAFQKPFHFFLLQRFPHVSFDLSILTSFLTYFRFLSRLVCSRDGQNYFSC